MLASMQAQIEEDADYEADWADMGAEANATHRICAVLLSEDAAQAGE